MARLRVLRDVVVDVYGPGNRAAFTFERAVEQLEHLQQELATQATWDLPGYPSNNLYFESAPPAAPAQGSPKVSPPVVPIAYTSAPPLLPVVKPVAPKAEEPSGPKLTELREGLSETD